MFKNPPGDFAGRLIEAAGLKGMQQGQAQISQKHANFFLNLGGATADDAWKLIQIARRSVAEKFGVILELEVELVGDWTSALAEAAKAQGGHV
jgi:UDP-N-acetylmuramate dehydrogenase